MQRRLIHALQDLVIEEKGEVRNGRDEIIQFVYGGDCNDPMFATRADYFESTRQDDVDTV
jgi:DNA-directed RNA polymerase beta' subunit